MTTVDFQVGTYNLHVNAVKHRPDAILRDIGHLFETAHVVVFQEAGEADKIIKEACDKYGLRVFKGYGNAGQSSTPILYRKNLRVKDFKSVLLTGARHVAPGAAGPSVTKPKWLNCVLFYYAGRYIWVTDIHTTPSVQFQANEEVVREQIKKADETLDSLRGIKIIGGDFNTLPDHKVRNPLEDKMKSAQVVGGRINTEHGRNIDDIYYTDDKDRIRLEHTWEFNGASDHDAYIVNFQITKRPLFKKE